MREKVQPVLMIGDTGSGKNYTIDTLGRYLEEKEKVPVIVWDASRLTPNGFSGNCVSDVIKLFKQKSKEMGVDNTRGIIYLDEICKIIVPNHDSHGENANALVQLQLLSMLSGSVIEGVDTSKLLFILGGAFADLRKLRNERKKSAKLGFSIQDEPSHCESTLREDLYTIGMQREFLGRISASSKWNSSIVFN